ncbi:hypothetical protein, partial [Streptomyces griseus]|uniref:hypothetical protein n=1 Tax=Streptomyces griseus TaxID=1911 RepID=UPI00214CD99D
MIDTEDVRRVESAIDHLEWDASFPSTRAMRGQRAVFVPDRPTLLRGFGPEAAQERAAARHEAGALLAHGPGAGDGRVPLQLVDGAPHRPYVLPVDPPPHLPAVPPLHAPPRCPAPPPQPVRHAPVHTRHTPHACPR